MRNGSFLGQLSDYVEVAENSKENINDVYLILKYVYVNLNTIPESSEKTNYLNILIQFLNQYSYLETPNNIEEFFKQTICFYRAVREEFKTNGLTEVFFLLLF